MKLNSYLTFNQVLIPTLGNQTAKTGRYWLKKSAIP
jgi:hypothetical protein